MNIKGIKNYIKTKSSYKIFLNFLVEKSRWVLLIFILLLFGYCGYFWKTYVYSYSWNEQRKQEYIKSKENGVAFNRSDFNEMVKESEKRKTEYERNIGDVTDIFRVK